MTKENKFIIEHGHEASITSLIIVLHTIASLKIITDQIHFLVQIQAIFFPHPTFQKTEKDIMSLDEEDNK